MTVLLTVAFFFLQLPGPDGDRSLGLEAISLGLLLLSFIALAAYSGLCLTLVWSASTELSRPAPPRGVPTPPGHR